MINTQGCCSREVSQRSSKLQAKLIWMKTLNRIDLNEECAGILKIKEK